ncbi:DUF4351 domain-containing protein [Gloeocapsopsis crepidinum LEGE 06123]|uniref:DUF4351 domain-containing protein n=1 Tax=Gloeocapsopsis crepidinum LEGE 06123 TaxID=588587 RepID=A0ABR9UY44_9CHRO|nr:DUF4351 domain-containing protein [Gloeocapsopsis crepidinum LEGE 06123]
MAQLRQSAIAPLINPIARQLTKRLGELPQQMRTSVLGLPLPALKDLSEALLDFMSMADLQAWLAQQG